MMQKGFKMANDSDRDRTIRLSTKLLQDAAIHGKVWNRSTAQQIEFWASIGQATAPFLSPKHIVAIGQGLAHIKVEVALSIDTPSQEFEDGESNSANERAP